MSAEPCWREDEPVADRSLDSLLVASIKADIHSLLFKVSMQPTPPSFPAGLSAFNFSPESETLATEWYIENFDTNDEWLKEALGYELCNGLSYDEICMRAIEAVSKIARQDLFRVDRRLLYMMINLARLLVVVMNNDKRRDPFPGMTGLSC